MAQPYMPRDVKDCLAAIYLLKEEGAPSPVHAVQERAERYRAEPAPKTASIIKQLIKDKLAEADKNKHIALTRKGGQQAEAVIKAHRLAQCLTADILDMNLETAGAHARVVESALTDEMLTAIAAKLDNPSASPYGQPIPGADKPAADATLMDSPEQEPLVISRIPEDDLPLIADLLKLGATPGAKIIVEESSPTMGLVKMRFQEEDREITIGEKVAGLIWATKVGVDKQASEDEPPLPAEHEDQPDDTGD